MTSIYTILDARNELGPLVMAIRGVLDVVVVTRRKRPVAAIVPIQFIEMLDALEKSSRTWLSTLRPTAITTRKQVSVTDAVQNFAELVQRVAITDQSIVLCSGHIPAAGLISLSSLKKLEEQRGNSMSWTELYEHLCAARAP